MNQNSLLRRTSDDKIFKVVSLAHWSEIESEDGEKDTVKWYGVGADGVLDLVGATSGQTYRLLKR
jgi:hypothetical protein